MWFLMWIVDVWTLPITWVELPVIKAGVVAPWAGRSWAKGIIWLWYNPEGNQRSAPCPPHTKTQPFFFSQDSTSPQFSLLPLSSYIYWCICLTALLQLQMRSVHWNPSNMQTPRLHKSARRYRSGEHGIPLKDWKKGRLDSEIWLK